LQFCDEALRLFGGWGLDIVKIPKTPLIYSVSRFNFEGLGTLFGVLSPPKPPRGDGTELHHYENVSVNHLKFK